MCVVSPGYVPHLISADGTLTGYENLMVFAKLYDVPRAQREQRVQEGLVLMGLEDAAHKLVRTYSGDMIRAAGGRPIGSPPPPGALPE
jgi:ABC-2 type transport system ATP-binding protein